MIVSATNRKIFLRRLISRDKQTLPHFRELSDCKNPWSICPKLFIRLLCFSETPTKYIPSIQSLLFQFLWKNKPDKIKRQVLYQDCCDGGLRITNVEIMLKSLRLAWIQRLLKNDGERDAIWALIPHSFLKRYGGLNLLLRCNYDVKFLRDLDIPLHYKQILQFFLKLKNH